MITVGAFEAKTNLSKLLERASKGETITIEKHGVPVAVLGPPSREKKLSATEAIAAIKEFSRGRKLEGVTIRELIEDGRK